MKTFLKIITEAFDEKVTRQSGGIEVFRNPSRREFTKLLRDLGYCARLSFCRNGDVLVFDGQCTHGDIFAGNGPDSVDQTYMTAMAVKDHLILHHAYGWDMDEVLNKYVPEMRANPNLQRIWGRRVPIVLEDDEGNETEVPFPSSKNDPKAS